ncbi:MAG: choice-of-anchor Q domain-containing protein, partial [Victivallaceae bacterium]
VYLFNTRILAEDIDLYLYTESKDKDGKLTNVARNINIYGANDGSTVISSGLQGYGFNFMGGVTTTTNDKGEVTGTQKVSGNVLMNRITVSDMVGGAIMTDAASIVSGSKINFVDGTISNNYNGGNGGAVVSRTSTGKGADKSEEGSFSFTNTLFAYNYAGRNGGAISVGKSVTATASTFAYNFAGLTGGAVSIDKGGTFTASNVTVAFNTAGGLGGGVFSDGTFSSTNSLYVSNNHYDYARTENGVLTNGGFNMVQSQNGTWAKEQDKEIFNIGPNYFVDNSIKTGDNTYGTDIVNQGMYDYSFNRVFLTGYLSDNGGWSKTIELGHDSQYNAAYDGIKEGIASADQRGYGVYGKRGDIGAYELNGTYAIVTTPGEGSNVAEGTEFASVADAYRALMGVGGVITLRDVRIIERNITISSDIIIKGTLSSYGTVKTFVRGTVMDARQMGRIFSVVSGSANVTLDSLHMTNGFALVDGNNNGSGGAIYNMGTLTVLDSIISNSVAQVSGGAIYNAGELIIQSGATGKDNSKSLYQSSLFDNNHAALNGGAIASNGSLTIASLYFTSKITDKKEVFTAHAGRQIVFSNNSALNGGAV